MFTLNEITKHYIASSSSSGTSESSDSSVESNDAKKMTLHLRVTDTTFIPKRSGKFIFYPKGPIFPYIFAHFLTFTLLIPFIFCKSSKWHRSNTKVCNKRASYKAIYR